MSSINIKPCRWLLVLVLIISGCAGQPGGSVQTLSQQGTLKAELKKLRNAVEEIQFETETAKRRQHNLFEDLDRRLLALERALRLSGGASPLSNEKIGAVSVKEQQAYEQAFGLLKQSKYQDAAIELKRFVKTWPRSQLADDAQYWMAEAYYVNRETKAALKAFTTVTKRYPNSEKVPEALLKMGYIKYDIGAYEDAAKIFRDILERFPAHQVAASAQTRLLRIEQTIQ